MSIYLDDIFYGEGDFYSPSDIEIPQRLNYYRTTQDGIYVFWWGFNSAFISPNLFNLDFELQIDTSLTFTSSNLQTFIVGLVTDANAPAVLPFFIVNVIDSTNLIVSTTSGLTIGDTISQPSTFSATIITSVIDATHLTVASTF